MILLYFVLIYGTGFFSKCTGVGTRKPVVVRKIRKTSTSAGHNKYKSITSPGSRKSYGDSSETPVISDLLDLENLKQTLEIKEQKNENKNDDDEMQDQSNPSEISPTPRIKTTINLSRWRSSITGIEKTMTDKLEKEISNYRLQKIEPPTGKEPDQLIYVLQDKNCDKKIFRITSKNLQNHSKDAEKKLCQWLERLIRPSILENIRWMKENEDKCFSYKVHVDEKNEAVRNFQLKVPKGRRSNKIDIDQN